MTINSPKKQFFFLPLLILLASCAPASNSSNIGAGIEESQQSNIAQNQQIFNYEKYDMVLKNYVGPRGLVDYAKLKENRQKLDEFNASLGNVSPSTYQSWTDNQKIAFLTNAYNSLTLESIIDSYPTKSIRNIPGVWRFRQFKVAGENMTLDHIEHQVLRKEFNEPGIHVALVCAAISCPFLRKEPFTGEKLESQLDDQARTFLSESGNFRIDRANNTVYLSSIFNWFGDDYKKTYDREQNVEGLNDKETALVNYISQYVSSGDREYLARGGYDVKYSNYDWSLNEQ